MKKVILTTIAATILLVAPARADVRVGAEYEGDGVVVVFYETDGEKVRAFALDITVTGGAIERVFDYHKGPSTAANPGYGIFPGTFARHITVDPDTGQVASWDVNEYTPVCDPCDPGALGGIGTSGMTVELAALYYPTDDTSPNAPGNSGTLLRLTVGEEATATVTLNEARGGVVLTDPNEVAVVELLGGIPICCLPPWEIPSSHADYQEWVAIGKPTCWGYTRQCLGDADGIAQGSAKTGLAYVATNDLNTLLAAWQIKEPPRGPGIASIANGICADFNRRAQGSEKTGFMRVGTDDWTFAFLR